MALDFLEAIIEEWRGGITKEAISEAVKLASKALVSHVPDYPLSASASSHNFLYA